MSKNFKEDFEVNAGGFYDGGISVSDEEERLEKELAPYEKQKTKHLICFIASIVFFLLALVFVLPEINKIFIGGIFSLIAVIFSVLAL